MAGIEYLEASDGRLIFYAMSSNLNLCNTACRRAAIAESYGQDSIEGIVFLQVSPPPATNHRSAR